MQRYDRALAASDRAVARSYGPRRLGILRTRARIQKAMGNVDGAKATLEGALAEAEALPAGQRSEGMIAALKKELEEFATPKAS
jgi:hypothetical protein